MMKHPKSMEKERAIEIWEKWEAFIDDLVRELGIRI